MYSKKGKFYDMEEKGESIICSVTANDGTEKYFEMIYLSTGLVSHCVSKWNNVNEEKIILKLEKYNYYGKGSIIINQKNVGDNIFDTEENKPIIEKNKEMIDEYFIKKIIGRKGEFRIWLEDFLSGDVYTYFIVECVATGEKYKGIGKVSHEQSSNLIRVGLWDYKKCFYNEEVMLRIEKKMKSSWLFQNS